MIEPATVTAAALSRLLAPLVSAVYSETKGALAKQFRRWKEKDVHKKVAARIESFAKVRTLLNPTTDVNLLDFYHPPNFAHDYSATGAQVIEGTVGQGKSILLRYLAINELKSGGVRLPVFIELRTLNAKFGFWDAIFSVLESFEIDVDLDAFHHLAKTGRLLLLLDGFDELLRDQQSAVIWELNQLHIRHLKMTIVVSSRPGTDVQRLALFSRREILPLVTQEYAPLLTKLGVTSVKIAAINRAIGPGSNLDGLITTPLMLTLVLLVYEFDNDIPDTIVEFFERLFHVVIARHDRMKPGFHRIRQTGLSDSRLQSLFETFCFLIIQQELGRSVTRRQFDTIFAEARRYSDSDRCNEDDFHHDIVKVSCLMLDEGVNTTTFLHKSISEYFAAAFIAHASADIAEIFYTRARTEQHIWQDVLYFLADIDRYRYAKHFRLPEIAWLEGAFLVPADGASAPVLIKLINSHYADFEAKVSNSNEVSFSYSKQRRRAILRVFDDLLENAVSESLRQVDEKLTKRTSYLPININTIVDHSDASEFRKAVDIFRMRVSRLRIEAEEVVRAHTEKTSLFENIVALRKGRVN